VICRIRDYGAVTVITAQTSPETSPQTAQPAAEPTAQPTQTVQPMQTTALAEAIDAQARRMDLLSAAIVRATSQVAWSGRAAERFRVRAAERSRECLQMAVALRASAERVDAAAASPNGPERTR
jgi:small-conductance mechanosensitive channel